MGVNTRAEQPTDWCAEIVVVPEPNENLRIRVNLTKLNESVREAHISFSESYTSSAVREHDL